MQTTYWLYRLALIKITKSPYPLLKGLTVAKCLALIKITKSPYQQFTEVLACTSLALIKITKSPYHTSRQ